MDAKVRVLVIEDSFLMRRIISDIVNSDPELEVIGRARDGDEAVAKVMELSPDVITLDVNLPLRDGIDVLTEIMQKKPTRVIMLSAYTRSGASATMRALELGAVDFIAKPSGEISLGLDKLRSEIVAKIKLAAKVDLEKYLSSFAPPVAEAPVLPRPAGIKKCVVIGASTGGPKAVLDIMKDIPETIPACFLVVQHMPKGFTSSFAERISWQSAIKAKEAEQEDVLAAGRLFVAPAGYHMVLEHLNGRVVLRLTIDPPVNFVRPSIDVTMLSAAEIFGKDTIGVILTGMGKDGLEGVRKIKEKGGNIIVQDEETSVVWGMPRAVAKAGLADAVLPVSKISETISGFIKN